MGMPITRIESTIIPNTLDGKAFATEYKERLKQQGVFRKWEEDSTAIIIIAEYYFEVMTERVAEDGKN